MLLKNTIQTKIEDTIKLKVVLFLLAREAVNMTRQLAWSEFFSEL